MLASKVGRSKRISRELNIVSTIAAYGLLALQMENDPEQKIPEVHYQAPASDSGSEEDDGDDEEETKVIVEKRTIVTNGEEDTKDNGEDVSLERQVLLLPSGSEAGKLGDTPTTNSLPEAPKRQYKPWMRLSIEHSPFAHGSYGAAHRVRDQDIPQGDRSSTDTPCIAILKAP